jgi:tetratricopeptide (TPR) repeat protein
MLAGDPAGAERVLRQAEAKLTALNRWWGFGFALEAMLADALCGQGRYDEAAQLTEVMPAGATDWLPYNVRRRAARAKALARLGRGDEAVGLARDAVALSEPTDGLNMRADALFDQAEVLCACGRGEEAGGSIQTALALYERKGNVVMAERARRVAKDKGQILRV